MQDTTTAEHLNALASFPEALKRQVQGLPADTLRYRPAPDAWSVIEIVGHLIEVEALWGGRIRHMLSADGPVFPPYDPHEVVRQRDYQNKQLGGLLITFAERRAEHLEFLRGLRPTQLARIGTHPTRGQVSVGDGIAILAGHDRLHADQIAVNLGGLRL